jgi:hypothetical protein
MPEIVPAQLHQRHVESQFANDPAIVETAAETGCVSVDSPEQLPESLRDPRIASFVNPPGLLFWHQPLGGGDPVPQFRPDRPVDDGPKYVFPYDVSCISITPSMQRRLDNDASRSNEILIVEGTKQNLFAATYAPDDVVVVGIQGCWGWSRDKMAVAELDDLCKGRRVVIAFDADISSNQKVYDAAERLALSLSTIGAKTVKFLKVPGSKTIGLDDFIARRPADNRSEPLATMIASAITFTKMRKPPRTSTALSTGGDTFDFISENLGEVIEAVFESVGDNGEVIKEHASLTIAGTIEEAGVSRNVRRVSTLLRGAPRIITTVEEKDDLTVGAESKFYHDIELQIGPKSASSDVHIIRDVPDEDLAKVRTWIARAGTVGLYASLGRGGQGVNGQARIAEAMRDLAKHSDVERRTVMVRTGWVEVDGVAVWVDAGGAHGPNGKVTSIKARLEGSVAALDIPGYEENYTMDDVVKSAKVMLDVCDWLYDDTSWVTGIAGIFWALAGGYPDAVLYFVGGAGSGKSSITGAMASIFSPKWGTGADPMASVEGTTAYLTDTTRQIHNCPLILDDARDRSSTRSQENQDEALDAVIRVGYGGGGAARGRKVQNAAGSWRQSAASSNRPFVIIAGETLPDSAPLSTIERVLAVEIKAATSLKTPEDSPDGRSGLEHFVEISRTGALRPLVSYFLHQTAWKSTNSMNGSNVETNNAVEQLDDIRERFENARTEVAKTVIAEHWPKIVPASQRVLQVVSTFIAGASIMFETVMDLANNTALDMTQSEVDALEYEWHSKIVAAAASHASTNLASGSEVDRIIAMVRGEIMSGRCCIGIPTHGQTCVGAEVTVKIDDVIQRCVALIPKVVGDIIGNHHNLPRRMLSVLVPDKDGRPTRIANINGTNARSLVVRGDVWYKDDDPNDVPPPQLNEDF